jgi:hypothetical protein
MMKKETQNKRIGKMCAMMFQPSKIVRKVPPTKKCMNNALRILLDRLIELFLFVEKSLPWNNGKN